MKVTRVRLIPAKKGSKQIAFGHFDLDGEFRVNVSVLKSKAGNPYILLPSFKKGEKKHREHCHPLTADLRKGIVSEVLSELKNLAA